MYCFGGTLLKKVIAIPVFLILYYILVFIIFKVESSSADSNIKSIYDAIWYSLVTLTTVGYGDFYPVTKPGKFLGLILIFSSLGIIGILIGRTTEYFRGYKEHKKMGYYGTKFKDHIIIVGWDDFSRSVTPELINADKKVAVITDKKDDIELIYEQFSKDNIFVLYSDFHNVAQYAKANIMDSAMVFINLSNDSDNLICVLNIKKHYENRSFLVTLEGGNLKETFQSAGVTCIISKNEIAAKLTASYIFEPDVAHFASDLLSSTKSDIEYDFQQFKVVKDNPYVNKRYGDVFYELKKKYNIVLAGLCKTRAHGRELIKLPEDDQLVELNDYLIMILNGKTKNDISKIFQVKEGIF